MRVNKRTITSVLHKQDLSHKDLDHLYDLYQYLLPEILESTDANVSSYELVIHAATLIVAIMENGGNLDEDVEIDMDDLSDEFYEKVDLVALGIAHAIDGEICQK